MKQDRQDGDEARISALLEELAALRDLDDRRHALPPDSQEHAIAAAQVERRSRSLMDRFRQLQAIPADAPSRERPRRQVRPRSPVARPRHRRRDQPPVL
ncbi:MAG: hypothetical protein FIA92_10220 [Chloroflexi bacterium]|nr:hypothetical protein [Chloroflexota bacterium]